MQQVFIVRKYWDDKKAAYDAGVQLPKGKNPTKVELYQLIAAHLGIDITGLELDALWSAIDDRNMDLACVGIAEHLVVNESTVVDKMATRLNKPVLVRPVQRPVKLVDIGVVIMRPGKAAVQRPKLRVR